MSRPRLDNSDLLIGFDSVSDNLAECIELAQVTLNQNGIQIAENPEITHPRFSSSKPPTRLH